MASALTTNMDTPRDAEFGDYYELLKPRVMSLVIFTAFVGLIVAPVGVHPFVGLASILCVAVGAGASAALNMWWDADIDRIMARTQKRPIPSGRVTEGEALSVGVGLSIMSVAMLGLFANWLSAGILAFTIFFYAVIYTMWLKRLTPQNIVIGGAAGAFPPMIGWAAATGDISGGAWLMFALIFMWTPPHFWALAIFRNEDYVNADVPMMPVAAGTASTRRQIWWYTVLLTPIAIAPAFTSIGGAFYLVVSVALSIIFLKSAWVVSRRDDAAAAADKHQAEVKLFKVSLIYLFALFTAILIQSALKTAGYAWALV